MKRILTIMAAIVCLAACEKPIDTSKIIGTWSECYDDPNFVMDGNVITLKTAATDSAHSPSYTITELNDNEMSWQKVGTTYIPGSNGSDYKHFKRK